MTTTTRPMNDKVRSVMRLTRWQEYVPTVIPLTVCGAILALQRAPAQTLDWRLIAVLLGNILVQAYAFMINDIEDAPDDAREAARAARNPVANGELTPLEGWMASGAIAAVSLVLFALGGLWPLVFGCLTLALSHLYSWKPIRLKAYPVTDFVSHSLMLSGLLFCAGYFIYDNNPGTAWLVALAVTFVSCYGQLYNQIRDFEMDKLAGLNNTAILVGKRNAELLMYGFVALALVMLVVSLVAQVIPIWVALFVAVATPLVFFFIRSKGDARGSSHVGRAGSVQWPFIVLINIVTFVWLAVTLVTPR
jgi:4-hydroxybenzoate polyprenyltransferase